MAALRMPGINARDFSDFRDCQAELTMLDESPSQHLDEPDDCERPTPPMLAFLFTDIEKSAQLWERFPSTMGAAVARHDSLLERAIAKHKGRIFHRAGDSIAAIFDAAFDAAAAAADSQLALGKEQWDGVDAIRVRMAIHVGLAEERGGDYFGQTLNRVARLMSAGHGGQILVSEAAFDACKDDISFRDMGIHRLKDLQQPEHIYQLLHPELESDFDPLRTLTLLPHNLPRQLTSFVGRESEIEEIQGLLRKRDVHLITLTGAGGCGKTRLAIQAAAEMVGEYVDGAWLAELAPLSDGALIPNVVAAAIGIQDDSSRAVSGAVIEHLRPKSLLLILDNCEHLILDSTRFIELLLNACPEVKILATSREELKMPGEVTRRVPSLSVADPSTVSTTTDASSTESVSLFLDRAATYRPGFALTDVNAHSIAQICWRLDGIPLAIELAAARVKLMPADQIAARLDDRFRLLTGGGYRTVMRRQQTLRATIDWSYDLLSEEERMVLRRLAAFAGGWTLEAAESVCAGHGIDSSEVLELLGHLVDKSLVMPEADQERPRFRLLESIREYCLERLFDAREAELARAQHRDYFLRLAEAAEPHLRGPEQPEWLSRLAMDHDNLRAAMEWSLSETRDDESAMRLSAALWRYFIERGHFGEGRKWLEQALEDSPEEPTKSRAAALHGLGTLAYQQSDWSLARRALEESRRLWRDLADEKTTAQVLNNLGVVALEQRDYASALAYLEESLSIRERVSGPLEVADARLSLATVFRAQGEYDQAMVQLREGLNLYKRHEHQSRIALATMDLGLLLHEQGEYSEALDHYGRALDLARAYEILSLQSHCLLNRGNLRRSMGDVEGARDDLDNCLPLKDKLGDRQGMADCLTNRALWSIELGDLVRAEEELANADALYREVQDEAGMAAVLEAHARLALKRNDPCRVLEFISEAAAIRERIHAPLPPNELRELDAISDSARAVILNRELESLSVPSTDGGDRSWLPASKL